MLVSVSQQLTDYEGRKLVDGSQPVTFRTVFATALNAFDEKDRPAPERMAQIYALSVKLYAADQIDLTLEEAALIKERVGQTFNPLVYGRTCDLLEGRAAKSTKNS